MRIELGNGQYADVLEVDDLRDGHRTKVNAAIQLRVDPDTKQVIIPGDMDDAMRRALYGEIITGWNLNYPVPGKRPDSLDHLTFDQADALRKGTEKHFKAVRGTEDEENADPTGGS